MTARDDLRRLHQDIVELLDDIEAAERAAAPMIDVVAPGHRPSAMNLVHYWELRQLDLRAIQGPLAELGLSSMGRSEAHVRATLSRVAVALEALQGNSSRPDGNAAVDFGDGARLLAENANALLGPPPGDRWARIMVTLPPEAATDPGLVARLIDSGMAVARINCAHDDPAAWRAMAGHVRRAAGDAGRDCLIAMDLAGPKLRTGPLRPGPKVLRLRPTRNDLGRTTVPARAWLTSTISPAEPTMPGLVSVPVPGAWLRELRAGDVIELRDTRDSRRWLEVERCDTGGVVVGCEQTVYLGTGTLLTVVGTARAAAVGELPPVDQALRVAPGDLVRVTRDLTPAAVDAGELRIGCTLGEVFDNIRIGHRVFFDDGKLGGRVAARDGEGPVSGWFDVRIDHPAHRGVKLRAAKGINVPDTTLPISALTDKDLADLRSVLDIADMVNLSFVRTPEDVTRLLDELDVLGADELGVVLKIETRAAFEHLPQLLLTAMRRRKVGVMIARGDLAVECGFERLAEIQEEILWLCEAAHLPVIWATQVLEQLARTGSPSRAEISDAALAERAECVMLNKGPYIGDAIDTLRDVLVRMAGHHDKKRALLRHLRSWQPVAEAIPI